MDKKIKATALAAVLIAADGALAGTADEPSVELPEGSVVHSGFAPSDFKLFVDASTDFTFVKTPYGWKFVRSLDDASLGRYVKLEALREFGPMDSVR